MFYSLFAVYNPDVDHVLRYGGVLMVMPRSRVSRGERNVAGDSWGQGRRPSDLCLSVTDTDTTNTPYSILILESPVAAVSRVYNVGYPLT